jgi:hypothetical protein
VTGRVEVTSAVVRGGDGAVLATLDLVPVGGGTRVIEGEVHTHAASEVWHVRLISPDVSLPDQLRECADYEAAVSLGEAYAVKVAEHADRVADLARDLEV